MMCFLTLEDLVGTVEVLVFPTVYDRCRTMLQEDARLFISGRVSLVDDENAKLIADQIIRFEDLPRELWVQFSGMEEYKAKSEELFRIIDGREGMDEVVVYLKNERAVKRLGSTRPVTANASLISSIQALMGENNVKAVPRSAGEILTGMRRKSLEKRRPTR